MNDDTSQLLDTKLLDNVAGSTIRPPGLLFGISPITATTGGGIAALVGDLSNLIAAIPAAIDPVLIIGPSDAIRALTLAPGLITVPIITAPGLTAKTVICLDGADFVSAEGDSPRFDMSDGGTLHEEDVTPLALSATGSPNVVAAPMRSLFQTDAVAIRMIQFCGWAMRRAGRVSTTSSITW
jgi:hypothetical protein